MNLEIVTPDRRVVVLDTDDVIVPGIEGEMEVLPGHSALLSGVGTGILSFKKNGALVRLMVSGGFVEVDHDRVTLMVESAALADEVVREVANKSMYDAEAKLKQLGAVATDDENFLVLRAEVDRAAAALTLLK